MNKSINTEVAYQSAGIQSQILSRAQCPGLTHTFVAMVKPKAGQASKVEWLLHGQGGSFSHRKGKIVREILEQSVPIEFLG